MRHARKNARINWLARQLPDPADQRIYATEKAKLAVTEALLRAIRDASLARQSAAIAIGCSKSHLSQLLSGRRNMTVRSISDILWACDFELSDLTVKPIGTSVVPADWEMIHETTASSEVVGTAVETSNLGGWTAISITTLDPSGLTTTHRGGTMVASYESMDRRNEDGVSQ